ncbi:MAG TPA: penicillin-binding protein 2 [Acidimicrobiia bacterium]|nr:penicillin-binding protein 2 [Acidimicrobiia bacterium]
MSVSKPRRISAGRARMSLIGLVVIAAWLGMGYRLFEIQVVRAPELAEEGLSQRLVTREMAPQRGKIYDRNGNLLAMTVESQSLFAVPDQVEEPLWVAQQIGGLLGVDSNALHERLVGDRDFVYIKRQVDGVTAQQILDLGMKGVFAHPEPTRVYPAGEVAAHVTGFVNIDGDGQEGLELVYDEQLRGTPGHAEYERDLAGRVIPQGYTNIVPAIPGLDLVTTIDLPLQYQAQESCVAALDRTGGESCWAVVLSVETGEILAMVGAPVFDPVTRQTVDPACAEGEDPATCLQFSNFVVRGIYEPGSTQKMITFAAALEEGTVKVGTLIDGVADEYELLEGACDSGEDDVHGCYRDFDEHDTEDMTVAEIFTASSNVGTIRVAEKLGEDRMVDYIESFGLGSATGVDYSAEASGILRFDAGCQTCLASAAIGYSVAATPLQMAAAYAAIGNDGIWTTPHIVKSQVDAEGDTEVAGIETRKVVSPGTALIMRELLAGVIEEGTGTNAAVDGYRVGGKTGTANKLGADNRYTDETRASFVGMAPIDDPEVVVAVMIDSPDYEFRTGGLAAAPVFSEIMEQALHRLGVSPDGRER